MPKTNTRFVCQKCGFESIKWLGKCPDCASWNSLTEEIQVVRPASTLTRVLGAESSTPRAITDIAIEDHQRVSSGIGEFDRVLGGGIVPGSLILIGGEPGIGKTTLLTQVAHLLGRMVGTVLYVSGEESERQIKLRGERLGIDDAGSGKENVDLPLLVGYLCVKSIEIHEIRHVALDGGNIPADQGCSLVQFRLPSAGDVDESAFLDEALGGRETNSAAAARDNGNLPREF